MLERCDYLVIGSGLAGLSYALKVADHGRVVILSKTSAPQTNTAWAQGGIAAVMSSDDSFENHIRDTMIAGAGLCHEEIVRHVVETAPARIQDLMNWGVIFDVRDDEGQKINMQLDLSREGGHSHRRVLHVEDHTGRDVHSHLLAKAIEHPNIEIREHSFAMDLILDRDGNPFDVKPPRCIGANVYNKSTDKVTSVFARFVLLASGGAGKTYLYTSNWSGATGDGIAMAYRAGARVANLEFMQFHPTCLYHPDARNFLITEALRGEGAELINGEGVAFAKKVHPMGSLAPRDIVARAIDAEMKRTGAACVYLDATKLPEALLKSHFPDIYKTCLEFGIDCTKDPIPVVPAAHYLCGGVLTDINGCSDIRGLLAAGETACTGLHGANRLASNSLLECLVFSHNAAEYSIKHRAEFPMPEGFDKFSGRAGRSNEDEMVVITHVWEEIRRLMWNYVGIVRSNRRLERAKTRLQTILAEVSEYYGTSVHPDIIELRNIALVADLTVSCALSRKESRGIHFNMDYPETDTKNPPRDSILPSRA
jgi:L-aspartate oxidase